MIDLAEMMGDINGGVYDLMDEAMDDKVYNGWMRQYMVMKCMI